jgi:hypothetical protein
MELSNENDIPDIPDIPDNIFNKGKLLYVSDMLSLKYDRFTRQQYKESPLEIIISKSPISSSPLILQINNYLNSNLKKILNKHKK